MTEETVVYEGRIAGIPYGHYKFRPDRLVNRQLSVVPKPDNEYDPQAIALLAVNGSLAHHVGYVPKEHTGPVHAALASGHRPIAIATGFRKRNVSTNYGTRWIEVVDVNVRITTLQTCVAPKLRKLNPAGIRRILA